MQFRKIWLFLICFLLTNCVDHKVAIKQPDPPTLQELARDATVAFVDVPPAPGYTDMLPYCTGVWINRTTMLTALHCAQAQATNNAIKKLPPAYRKLAPLLVHRVLDPTGVKMQYSVSYEMVGVGKSPKKWHEAVVVLIDSKHDLALVKTNNNDLPHHGWLPIAESLPNPGDKLIIIGHPAGLYYSLLEGTVAAYREDLPRDDEDDILEGPFVQVYSGIWHGNSGGALVSQKGEIIGIVSFLARSPMQSFCIAAPSINKFLHKANGLHLLLNK